MGQRHDLRKLRLLQRSIEESVRRVLKEPDKFGISPFGETSISMDRPALEGIVAFCVGRYDGEKESA